MLTKVLYYVLNLLRLGKKMIKMILTGNDARRLIHKHRRHRPRIVFYHAVIDHFTIIKGDLKEMIITDTQEVDLTIQPMDAKGNPAQVDGIPEWVSSDPLIATVVPAVDGLSCVVKAANNLGHVQISVSADADLGEGTEALQGVLELDVVAGKAVALSVIVGEPREQV
jgi:hypothetical protein